MRPGIPPSLDRQERQFSRMAGLAALAVLFLAILYLTVIRPAGRETDSGAGASRTGTDRLHEFLAEEERASAYEALRDYLDQKKHEPNIAAVFCRDSSHRWVDGDIEFEGDVDFEVPSGSLERHTYRAVLRGSEQDGWDVVSVEVDPAAR